VIPSFPAPCLVRHRKYLLYDTSLNLCWTVDCCLFLSWFSHKGLVTTRLLLSKQTGFSEWNFGRFKPFLFFILSPIMWAFLHRLSKLFSLRQACNACIVIFVVCRALITSTFFPWRKMLRLLVFDKITLRMQRPKMKSKLHIAFNMHLLIIFKVC